MRKCRFADKQMVEIQREADRTSVAEAANAKKVSEQSIYGWRRHFGGLAPADVKRLKTLDTENARLNGESRAQSRAPSGSSTAPPRER